MKPKRRKEERSFSPFSTQRIDSTGKPIETVHIDIANDMRIGRDLQKALRTSMSTWAWYAQLKEQAHVMMKQMKYRVHCTTEELYAEIKEASPKLTETAVKNRIHLDSRWRKRMRRYMRWRDRFRMLQELCTQLKERNDNLRTLEASERRERGGAY